MAKLNKALIISNIISLLAIIILLLIWQPIKLSPAQAKELKSKMKTCQVEKSQSKEAAKSMLKFSVNFELDSEGMRRGY